MRTCAEALYNFFEDDENNSITPAIIHDLFGMCNWDEDILGDRDNCEKRITLMIGLYKGLHLMRVPCAEIFQSFLNNNLDNLIHEKYNGYESGYYKEFCENKIKIGATCL